MNYRVFFDIPDNERKHIKGSSPILLDKLIEELKGADKVQISAFLYNNPVLQVALENMAKEGCQVKIFSLPLQGYDTRESRYIYYNNFRNYINASKYEYAVKVYERVINTPNMDLKIFPHTYIWAKQKTSRGNDLYSLHNKSIFAEFPNKKAKCITTSCNFAIGDPRHSENLLVVEDCSSTTNMFKTYFELMEKHSLFWSSYIKELQKNELSDIEYIVKPTNLQDTFRDCYFTAPFIKYDGIGSNHYVQKSIIDFISDAKEKVHICSQHFSDIDSFDKNALSIVEKLKELASKNPKMDIKILKQTRASHQEQPTRTQRTEDALNMFENIKIKFWSPIIHDKFIIVDSKIMVSSANYTSTNYAWAENHTMKYQLLDVNKKIREEIVVKNTFSEINSFHFINEKSVTALYEQHFYKLWNKSTLIM